MANPKGGVFDRFKEEILEMHSRNVPAIDMAHVLKSKHPEQLPGKAKDYAVTIRGNLRRLDVQPSITPSIPSKTTASNDFHALKTELNIHENIYGLPEPLDDSVKTFKLPTGCNNILFITDAQIPFHDNSAITCALKYGKQQEVNTIFLNGDMVDFYSISSYEKDKKFRDLVREIEMTREFLGILRNLFPNAQIYYKDGNHEERWQRYIREHAKEFDGLQELEFAAMFHLDKLNIHHITRRAIVNMGGLSAIHAHEVRGVGGVFPGNGHLVRHGRMKTR